MYGRVKEKRLYGKFVSEKDERELKKAQKMRLIFTHLSALTLAVMLFIPQEWAEKTKDVLWLQSAYVLLIIGLVVVFVIAEYGASKPCNLTREISEKYKPRFGFEKSTFASAEWLMLLHALLALAQIALAVYGFGIFSLINAVLATIGAAFAVVARMITFNALKSDLKYIPPENSSQQESDEQKPE